MKVILRLFILVLFECILCHSYSQFRNKNYSLERLPFNTDQYDEFAPVMYHNGIVFCSDREKGKFIRYSTPDNKPVFDLFFIERSQEGWDEVNIFSKHLNFPIHKGALTFSKDKKIMYYTRNINKNRKAENNKLGIFIAENTGDQWVEKGPFKYNRDTFNVQSPALNPEGTMLFFVSDMPGGFGGKDIYVCTKKGNEWMKPRNLGKVINTDGNEGYPFISESGRIYFTSDKHDKIGRFDIFFSDKIKERWSKPVKLPRPFNSSADDYGYVSNRNNEMGYFSSNREGSDDIYYFTIPFPEFENCDKIRDEDYCIEVFEKGAMELGTTSFKYEWDFGDGTKKRGLKAEHCYSGPGTYTIELNVIDTVTNQVFMNEATYPLELEQIQQVYITSPDTSYVNKKIELTGQPMNLDFEISDYYWSLGDETQIRGKNIYHKYQKPGDYKIILGIKPKDDDEYSKICNFKMIKILPK